MRVHQSRHQDVAFQDELLVAGKARARLGRGKDCLDLAVAHRDGVLLQHRARRLDRHDPAGGEEGAGFRYLGVPCTSTTTLRFGPRHSISAARLFSSGQDFTGSVLPKPNTSTLALSVPFDTR